jgi:hypothetical protein
VRLTAVLFCHAVTESIGRDGSRDSFFDGIEEFVEFEELFVYFCGGGLEVLDFLGALGKYSRDGLVGWRWPARSEST